MLADLLATHGRLIGTSPQGEVVGLWIRDPQPMALMLIGPPETGDLLVLSRDDEEQHGKVDIRLPGPRLRGRLCWNPKITLEALLENLDPIAVVSITQTDKASPDSAN